LTDLGLTKRGESSKKLNHISKDRTQKPSNNIVVSDRWTEGLENHEKLKKLLPFMNEEDAYL